jgi:predicted ATPase
MNRVTCLEGRAISSGRNLSFHPIINLIKDWAHITEEDSPAQASYKLETVIRTVSHDNADDIFAFIATLMGMKLSGRYAERTAGIEGEALEKLIFKHMRDLLIRATEVTPLVIVIEDLHWADLSSIELLESLFRLAGSHPIVFINVFRPNYPETGDRIIATLKEKTPVSYLEIKLEPLTAELGETLIKNMLDIKGFSSSLISQIVERSGGNPFFIEEVVRSFVDAGAVVRVNGEFKITEKIENIVIPQTVNDVLMARIDRLDDDTRDLVKMASVIGRSFFYVILTEVAQAIDDIDQRLSRLTQMELIRERQRMQELEYLFKHALAQEVAYESILSEKRKELHRKTADSIEKIFSQRLHEFFGILAYHYSNPPVSG